MSDVVQVRSVDNVVRVEAGSDIVVNTSDVIVRVDSVRSIRVLGSFFTYQLSYDPSLTWDLPIVVVRPHESLVYLNGVRQRYGLDYMIDGVVFTWLGRVRLDAGDELLVSIFNA